VRKEPFGSVISSEEVDFTAYLSAKPGERVRRALIESGGMEECIAAFF
jgi:hypothetical protein